MLFRQFGWPELLIVLAIVLLLFGAAWLPRWGRTLGKTIRGWRESVSDDQEEEPGKQEGQ